MSRQPMKIVALAGGSASGKSSIAAELERAVGAAVLPLDAYYRHTPELSFEERAAVDVDHPQAFESDLLADHLRRLRRGETVAVPRYDFCRHLRRPETDPVSPRPVVVVEGILVLAFDELLSLFDHRVFVEAPSEIRFDRRLRRDVTERGRTPESVGEQWAATVERGYLEHCEPTRRRAQLVVSGTGDLGATLEQILRLIEG